MQGVEPDAEHIERALDFLDLVIIVPVDSSSPEAIRLTPRVRSCYAPNGRELVSEVIEHFNPSLIHLEGYFLLQHVPPAAGIPLQLTAENIEHTIFETSEPAIGTNLSVAEEEVLAWRQANLCIAVTEADASVMRRLVPEMEVHCITNGFDHVQPLTAAQESGSGSRALYAANYGWYPSRRAAFDLLQDVWPPVADRSHSFSLLLAGKGIDSELMQLSKRTESVKVLGEYGAFSEVAAKASVFVFPMSVGSGIKVKLIDAFVSGLAVVTSELALSGFPDDVTQHAIASDDLKSLSGALSRLLAQPLEARSRGRFASEAIVRCLPTWNSVAKQVDQLWRRLISTE